VPFTAGAWQEPGNDARGGTKEFGDDEDHRGLLIVPRRR